MFTGMHWSNEGYEDQNEDCRFSKLDSWQFANGHKNSQKLATTNTTPTPFSLIQPSHFDELTIYLEENEQLVAVLKARNIENSRRVYIKLTMGEAMWGYDIQNINNHLCYGEWGAEWEKGTDFKPTINRTLVKPVSSAKIPTRLPDDVLISDEWKSKKTREINLADCLIIIFLRFWNRYVPWFDLVTKRFVP